MKRKRLIHIAITSIMLFTTIVTPQMSYVLANAAANDDGQEVVDETENDDVDAMTTEGNEAGDDGTAGDPGVAEVAGADDTEAPAAADEIPGTEDAQQEDFEDSEDNKGPPADEVVEEDVADETDEEEVADDALGAQSASFETFNEGKDLGNIFTFESLKFGETEIENDDVVEIVDGSLFALRYTWNTEDQNAVAGDTASISLPDVFKQVDVQERPLETSGIQVGVYSIIDGTLKFVFNEKIEDGAVQEGYVDLSLEFDLSKFEDNVKQEIKFNDKEDKTLNIIAKPSKDVSGITKEGHPDRDVNAREIIWTVDVINDNDEPITSATLADILPEGLGAPRDFKINELTVGINGDKDIGESFDVTPTVDDKAFSIDFENIAPYSGYRVTYKTTIDDYDIKSFTNKANFSYGDTDLPAVATVSGLERSNPIQKDGTYNWNTHQIDWTITVNESGSEIDEAIVYDTLPAELSLVEESIYVDLYDSNWNWKSKDSDKTEFPINLGPVSANEIYQISFSTTIDWTKVNGGEYKYRNQFTNHTDLNDGDVKIGEADKTVDHWRASLLEKTGASNVNYENKTLTWTVEVNKAKHPLSNVVVNDVIPEGLSISAGDITVTGENGEAYAGATTSVNGQDVTITLGDIGTETIKIEYTTTIEDFTKNVFDNKVTLAGDGIGVETPEDNHEIKPPANSFAKGFKGIDYNERTMDWSLIVNPIREAITELTIVDTFPNKGMILLPDTVKVTVGGNKVETGSTVTPNTEGSEAGYHKGFTIVFDDLLLPLNAQMEITYQTSYDPQREVDGKTLDPHVGGEEQAKVYKNHAQFTGKTENGHGFNTGKDAETTVRQDSWNSGKKEGQLVHENANEDLVNGWVSGSERKIAWQLYTNYQQQNLGTGVVITDTLAYEGTIDEGSVVVKEYTVDAAGNTKVSDTVLPANNYTVNYDGKTFTLTFADGFVVSERYVVEFTTTVPNISQPNYTNNATVKVGEVEHPYTGTVNYDKHDHFLRKSAAGITNNQVFTGDEVEWNVTVNESLSTILLDVNITDRISPGLVYVEGSLEITTGSGINLELDTDYELDVSTNEEEQTVLSINLLSDLTETLDIKYSTVVTETDGKVNNTVEFNGTDIDEKTVTSQELNARQFSSVGGQFNPNRGAIEVAKIDYETEEIITSGSATFELWYELNGEKVKFEQEEAFTTKDGILKIGNLPLRTYYLKEVESPEGYVLSEEEIKVDVTTPYGNNEFYHKVAFKNIAEVEVSVTKQWEDSNNQDGNRPETITVILLANGEETEESILLTGTGSTWTGSFTNLPSKDEKGNEIKYTVKEIEVASYNVDIVSDSENPLEFIITNSYTPESVEISGTKTWEDSEDQDGIRPDSITVNLLANGTKVAEKVVTAADNWSYVFENQPKFAAGQEITYTVEEELVDRYEVSYDGFDIINTYTPELISINGTKTWEDAEDQDGKRPDSITVNLLADGEKFADVKVTAATDWQYTFSNLPKFAAGQEIKYTVEEELVDEYEVSYDGFDITNTHTPELISINGTKTWEDNNDQDGKRPEEITVVLLNGETEVETKTVTAADDWKYEFTNLPKYQNGEEVTYTIQELGIEDYETTIEGFNITNSHSPEKTSINVVKLWKDNNYVSARPDSVTVNLLANGEETDYSVELNADNEWQAEFEDLDRYDAGELIVYTIEEEPVEGYKLAAIKGNSADGFRITNEPIKVSVGDYVWIDENKDGLQDDTDTPLKGVVLTLEDEDGNPVTDVYGNLVEPTITNEEGWYTFDDLPADKTYTVKIDRIASEEALKGLAPTLHEVEDDKSIDSSTWEATSRHLTKDGERDPTLDFGFFRKVVSVGDYVWIDVNRDGLQDDTDIPIQGVVLTIVDSEGNSVTDVNGDPVGPTTTNEKGWYTFENLPADETYTVIIDREASAEVLEDYYPTEHETGEDTTIDSSTWEATSRYLTEDGERDPTLDFGFVRPAVSVGDYVWFDTNEDGLQDDTDVPLEGVVLTIEDENGDPVKDVYGNPVDPQVTDENGHYSFDNLPIDKTYTVRIDKEAFKEKYPEYAPTTENVGDDNEVDSSTWEATSRHLTEDGDRDPSLDFGFVPARVSVGDYVWIDVNRDGLQDDTDIPIKGVVLTLEDADGKPVKDIYGNDVKPTITDDKGWYTFDNLPINNTYVVKIDREASAEALKGLDVTLEHEGEDDSVDSSTWKAISRHLTEHLDRDPTLDFGFIRKAVSVGDYVWFDEDKDGLQDDGEPGIPGVVLEIRDENGDPVTDVYGKPVGPTTTDKNGWYTFDNLPAEKTYTVYINREQSAEALKGLVPTIEGAGTDRANDSSTWIAISRYLEEDGERDPTLDFGFVLEPEEPETPVEPEEPGKPTEPTEPEKPETPEESDKDDLPKTGEAQTYAWLALTLVGLGLVLRFYNRRRTN